MFWFMNSFLTWIPFHHLHISIKINYYWNLKTMKNELPDIQSVTFQCPFTLVCVMLVCGMWYVGMVIGIENVDFLSNFW